MKIPDHELRTPLVKKKKPMGGSKPKPDSFRERCKKAGVKVHPSTIWSRMQKYGISFEEAISYRPMSQNEAGRRARKNNPIMDGIQQAAVDECNAKNKREDES